MTETDATGSSFSIAVVGSGGAGVMTIGNLLMTGIGIWGNNVPVGWAFDIINFVWWIGIGHAGTLISAILLLLRQEWRTSINRFAEAMTIFAVICAAMFPGVHVGRPWLAYWLFPIPNQMGMWPQFRSPLLWDVFAVSIYGSVSVLFWFVGLIPDLATMRDRAQSGIPQRLYGLFALGWRGSAPAASAASITDRTAASSMSPGWSSSGKRGRMPPTISSSAGSRPAATRASRNGTSSSAEGWPNGCSPWPYSTRRRMIHGATVMPPNHMRGPSGRYGLGSR